MPGTGVNLNNDVTLDIWRAALASQLSPDDAINMAQSKNKYIAIDELFTKDRLTPYAGTEWEERFAVAGGGNVSFGNAGRFRPLAAANVVKKIHGPWAGASAAHTVTTTEIRRTGNSKSRLEKLVNVVRSAAWLQFLEAIESKVKTFAEFGSEDPLSFFNYFAPITSAQAATATVAGAFQGVHPSGWSSVAGLSAVIEPMWRNYNFGWTNSSGDITEEDLKRMSWAHTYSQFKAPSMLDNVKSPMFSKYVYMTCKLIMDGYATAMRRGRNDIGLDPTVGYGARLDPATGDPVFKGLPLQHDVDLDTADTTNRGTNPLLALNRDYSTIAVEEGQYFVESGTAPLSQNQPDVLVTHVDLSYNIVCTDRRKGGWLGSYVA